MGDSLIEYTDIYIYICRLGSIQLGKPPSNSRGGHLGIARKGGWVLTLARMVWGTFLEKNLPRSNGHLLGFGGV